MPTTPNLALRYPAATDAPDGPGAFLALATDIDNTFKVQNWTPVSVGQTVSAVANASVVKAGHVCIATAFFQLSGPISPNQQLTLPIPAGSLPGVYITVGEVEYMSQGDNLMSWRGRLVARNDAPTVALFQLDIVNSSRNSQVGIGPANVTSNAPWSNTGAFYVNVRLQYAV